MPERQICRLMNLSKMKKKRFFPFHQKAILKKTTTARDGNFILLEQCATPKM